MGLEKFSNSKLNLEYTSPFSYDSYVNNNCMGATSTDFSLSTSLSSKDFPPLGNFDLSSPIVSFRPQFRTYGVSPTPVQSEFRVYGILQSGVRIDFGRRPYL